MLYESIFLKHFTNCNLNTFVLENDFEYSHFLLTKLEHDSIIFPSLLLAYTFDVLDNIHRHNQPNTIRYLLCAVHYALCTMHYALCTMHYAYIFIRIYTYLLFYTYS